MPWTIKTVNQESRLVIKTQTYPSRAQAAKNLPKTNPVVRDQANTTYIVFK